MRTKVKTIDVNCKEWFDKINGNSYFAGTITVNYGMKTAKVINMPFQYGYGDHYRDMAFELLQKLDIIPKQERNLSYWSYYKESNIVARHSLHENCLKRELMLF